MECAAQRDEANDFAQFARYFNRVAKAVNETAHSKGFYEKPPVMGERLMLVVTEIAEAMEAHRHGNPPDDKVPEFGGIETELGDAIIRILDLAYEAKLDVAGAMIAKAAFNKTRPYKHGKNL